MIELSTDLETVSLKPNAGIQQIGWATFELQGEGVIETGQIFVDLDSCREAGLDFNLDTLAYWKAQEGPAKEAFNTPGIPLLQAMQQFRDTINWNHVNGIWSHGANFDLPILCSAFDAVDREVPWNYKKARCCRTLLKLAGEFDWPEIGDEYGVKHVARFDAVAQAFAMQKAAKLIQKGGINV